MVEKKSRFRDWIESFGIAVIIVFLLKALVFFPTKVEGASMQPTLFQGDKIIVNKAILYTHFYHRGDIVVLRTDDPYVKRIIGLPGDVIQMKDDKLYVNGSVQKEPYLADNQKEAHRLMMNLTENFGPLEISAGKVFVMGDNRRISRDSRNGLGLIEEKDILGKVEMVYYPFQEIRRTK
jgi:signal peptidase I